jgi:hypothetical protein
LAVDVVVHDGGHGGWCQQRTDTGHDLMIAESEAVADMLWRLATA